jgi:hypothetical protein
MDAEPSSLSPRWTSPLASRVKKSTPTARTSGSANGSRINGFAPRLATARDAAIIVAVAPTPLAKSQVSLLVRGIGHPFTERAKLKILRQFKRISGILRPARCGIHDSTGELPTAASKDVV